MPRFTEPAPGPRAPHAPAAGFAVETARAEQVGRALRDRGLACQDTRARAILPSMRERLLAERAARGARGEKLDGVTGASVLRRRSPMERNPQIRLRCDDVMASQVLAAAPTDAPGDGGGTPDDPAASDRGQLLLVFDSED